MNSLEKKIENQVQFWSLLGPFLILLSIAVLIFKISSHWYFPLSALIGIPLCVKGKLKGMAAALSCLFLFSAIAYQSLNLDERYWHVGMGLAMAFSFIILTLSIEEAQSLFNKFQIESQSRLDNFLLLDQKYNEAEKKWFLFKEKNYSEVQLLTEELKKTLSEKQTFYKIAQLAKDELLDIRKQHDLLLQELYYKKQQISQLNERLEDSEIMVQNFVNSQPEKEVERITSHLTQVQQEKETLKAQFSLAIEEGQNYRFKYDQLLQDSDQLRGQENLLKAKLLASQLEIQELQTLLKNFNDEQLNCLTKELDSQKIIIASQSDQLQLLSKSKVECEVALEEKEVVLQQKREELSRIEKCLELSENREKKLPYAQGNTRRLEGMYIQLKEQFEEKNNVLAETRRDLFHAEERLQALYKEIEEEKTFGLSANEESLQTALLNLDKQYVELENEYKQEVENLNELIRFFIDSRS